MMVTAYLENIKEDFLQEKLVSEKRIHTFQVELKENEEIQKMLKQNEDFNFEFFTPRETNRENNLRIKELEKQKEDILSSMKEEQKIYEKYVKNISILDNVIQSVSDADILWKEEDAKKCRDTEEEELFRIRLLETQENERQRISRELHDYTVQNLTSLIHRTELCSKLVDMDTVRCKLELNTMTKILREIISDTRQMIYNLHPMSFDDIGLDVTIERALDKLEIEGQVKKIHFRVEGESYPLKPVVGITILRIIQEACSNSICHANCSDIQVLLQYDLDQITIQISDDGEGFDIDEMNSGEQRNDNSGFGLAMMKERVYLLSGDIEINSEIGSGTDIIVHVPVNKEEI